MYTQDFVDAYLRGLLLKAVLDVRNKATLHSVIPEGREFRVRLSTTVTSGGVGLTVLRSVIDKTDPKASAKRAIRTGQKKREKILKMGILEFFTAERIDQLEIFDSPAKGSKTLRQIQSLVGKEVAFKSPDSEEKPLVLILNTVQDVLMIGTYRLRIMPGHNQRTVNYVQAVLDKFGLTLQYTGQ